MQEQKTEKLQRKRAQHDYITTRNVALESRFVVENFIGPDFALLYQAESWEPERCEDQSLSVVVRSWWTACCSNARPPVSISTVPNQD